MKPLFCPFCGNFPDPLSKQLSLGGDWAIYCPTCEYFGPIGSSALLAIAAWNERHHPYEAEIDQLKKELAALRGDKCQP